jgi:thiamine-monophosphate kinase
MSLQHEALLADIAENRAIEMIAGRLPTAVARCNRTHECDAELVDLGLPGALLAITTDSLVEEIRRGLYSDARTIGWMAIVVSLSDLAAVGARPVGVLDAVTFPAEWDAAFRNLVVGGMAMALESHGTGILGGDVNDGPASVTTTALGLVDRDHVMTRRGARLGDIVYSTGPAGLGNAFAFERLVGGSGGSGVEYRPWARLAEAAVIARYATSCIDSSDGLFATLDQLARLNAACICLPEDLSGLMHPSAVALVDRQRIPQAALLAGIHGDFELCFTIPADREASFLREMEKHGYEAVPLGVLAPMREGVTLTMGSRPLPSAALRNAYGASSSAGEYVRNVMDLLQGFGESSGVVASRKSPGNRPSW